jgi:serine phosphatase RsbU (regulator of sigma subunit)
VCEHASNGETFATVTVGILDPGSGALTIASAGHPPPVVVDPTGDVSYVEVDAGPPIGAVDDPSYPVTSVELAPGSTVLLFTDGVVERRDRGLGAGVDELVQAVRGRADSVPLEALCAHVLEAMLGGSEIADPAALLAVRLVGTSPG